MKNVHKRFGIIAIVAVIGLTFAALSLTGCNRGGGARNSGARSGGGDSGGGTLTIPGLPPNEPGGDSAVYVFPAGTDLSTRLAIANEQMSALNNKNRVIGSKDSADSNVFPIVDLDNFANPYTESGSREVVLLVRNSTVVYYRATVNFSNGSATVPFSNFTEVTSH